jgi:hypothetical protein
MISAKRINIKAAYRDENMVAYTWGNAANVTPPAVSSHTWLPSHKGPLALIIVRLSISVLPRNG